jgi:hypothetical protein
MYRRVKEAASGVTNVNVPVRARTHYCISITETGDAEVKQSAFAALATEAENLRFIVAHGVPKGKSRRFSPLKNSGIQTPCSI